MPVIASNILILNKSDNYNIITNNLIGLLIESTMFNPHIEFLSQTTCWVASEHAMYSASMVHEATRVFFALLWDIAPPASVKMYPDVDFLESL